MKRYFLLGLAACWLGGCIMRHEEHDSDDGYTGGRGGSTSSCGGTDAGGTSAGGSSGEGGDPGTGGIVEPPPPPECLELPDEAACVERADCEPLYAGTDCSCGPDCTCIGGEPGCVCESYGYLVCVDAETAEALR